MSKQAQHCLQRAAEFERLARAASDHSIKEVYIELARRWLELAKQKQAQVRERSAGVPNSGAAPRPTPDSTRADS
jgi:hypothetical protein